MAKTALFLLLTAFLALSCGATTEEPVPEEVTTKGPFVPAREPPVTSATPTTKKVPPTTEVVDTTKPVIVMAKSASFRPSPQIDSRSDSFTGSEPTFDVELASTLPEKPQAPKFHPPQPPATPVTQRSIYRYAPYGLPAPVKVPQQPFLRPPVVGPMIRRVPVDNLKRPVRHPGVIRGPPRPPQKPHLIYSKPPPEVIYYGDEPPPLDYEPPTVYRPRHRPSHSAYYSKPVPPEDEEDIMNILDHYIPDDEPTPIIRQKEESSSSGMSKFMFPMMLMGMTVNLFSLMYNFLLRRRRRRRRDLGEQGADSEPVLVQILQRVHDALEEFGREEKKIT